jgi:hypothetical protein
MLATTIRCPFDETLNMCDARPPVGSTLEFGRRESRR